MNRPSIDRLNDKSPIPRSAKWQVTVILEDGWREDQMDSICEAGLDNSGHLFAPKSVVIGFKTKRSAEQWLLRYRLFLAAKTGVAGFGHASVDKLRWFNLNTCEIT